jgi:hypothetical protein
MGHRHAPATGPPRPRCARSRPARSAAAVSSACSGGGRQTRAAPQPGAPHSTAARTTPPTPHQARRRSAGRWHMPCTRAEQLRSPGTPRHPVIGGHPDGTEPSATLGVEAAGLPRRTAPKPYPRPHCSSRSGHGPWKTDQERGRLVTAIVTQLSPVSTYLLDRNTIPVNFEEPVIWPLLHLCSTRSTSPSTAASAGQEVTTKIKLYR